MKKYKVVMTQEFYIKAESYQEAEDRAIELCAADSEVLMPHNMSVITTSANKAADSYFND
jgi:hypothetical protein